MISVSILLFAHYVDVMGSSQMSYTCATGSSVSQLLNSLEAQFPALVPINSAIRIAVNQEFCERSTILNDGDEVAIMPPMSGGRYSK